MVDGFGGATTTTTCSNQFGESDITVREQYPALLIVDSTVEDAAILLAGLVPGTHVVRAEAGKLADVAKSLEALAPAGAVHILTHGEPGAFTLGGERIDAASLESRTPFVDALAHVAASASSVALWACSVAGDAAGKSFVKALAKLTGAEIFAAKGLVGSAAQGASWSIGTLSPFSQQSLEAYPHTLPTFDFTGGTLGTASGVDGIADNQFEETESGVTMTVSYDLGSATAADDATLPNLTVQDLSGDYLRSSGGINVTTVTIAFDTAIQVDSFVIGVQSGTITGTYTFTPIGTGSAFTMTAPADFTNSATTVVTPTDWTSVTSFTITSSNGQWDAVIDTVNFTPPANSAPDLGGTPADDTATEDVATAIDLSAYNVSDTDGDTITLTLAVDRGTIASTDGNGTTSGVTVATSGTTSMTLSGSAADLNTYLNDTSKITFTTYSNDTTSATLTVTPNDGTVDGTADTVAITITAVNDDPGATGVPTDVTVTEDTASNVDLSAITLSDVDSASVTLTLTASAGTFSTPADGAGVGGGVTETLVNSTTITLVGAPADINTYLDTASNIQYTGASNASGNDAATITATVNDGDGSGDVALGTINLDITAVNDDPTISGLVTDVTVTEDTASNVDFSAVTFADVDSASMTVTLTASAGTFSTPADGAGVGGGVTETLVNSTTITLVGAPADINTYLDTASNIQYTGASNASGNDAATITVTGNDGDGSGDVALGTVNVDITAVNDAPVLDNAQSPALTAIDEDAGDDDGSGADGDDDATNNANNSGTTVATMVVDSSITDADGSAVESIAVTTVDNTNGVWQYSTDSGTSWNNFSGVTGTSIDIETSARLLDSADMIRFVPDADYSGSATITFRAWDETSGSAGGTADASSNGGSTAFSSASDTASITVNAVNDDPTISGLVTDVSFTEDTAGDLDLSASAFADVDSAGTVTVYLIASEGTMTATSGGSVTVSGSGSGTLTLSGTFANINTFLDTASNVQYTGASNDTGDNTATITVRANDGDGSGNVDLGTANVDITGVNDAPVLDNAQSPTLTAIDEDAGDDDGSGADGDDDATNNANNTGDTVASIVVDSSITDADGSAVEAIAVTAVDNTNGTWQFSTDSGTSWTDISSGTTSDSNALLLDSTDMLRFVPGADYSGSSTITFRAWDTTSGTAGTFVDASTNGGSTAFSIASDTASVTVSGVNDAPVFSGLDGTPAFTEGGSVVTFDADVTISDTELDSLNSSSGDYSGATLTIVRNGGANANDALSVVSGGNLTVAGGPNGGGTITAGGNIIATISNAGDDDEITITFNDNGTTPTTALVNEVMQAIRYSNSSEAPAASVQMDWTFSDGNSANAQGTGDNPGTASGSVTVSITGVNDDPTFSGLPATVTFTEDESYPTLDLSALTLADVDTTGDVTITLTAVNGTLGASIVGGVNSVYVSPGVRVLVGTIAELNTYFDGGNIAYNPVADASGNNADTITVTINDGEGSGDITIGTISVNLTPVNDAPGIANLNGDNSSTVVANDGAQDVTDLNDVVITNVDSADYDGGFLTLSQLSGTTNGSWSVDGTNVTSGGDGTIAAGETISVGGTAIGTVHATNDGQGGTTLQIDFDTADSTSANIQTLIRNLELSPSTGIGDRAFTLTLNDGDGTANGGDEDHAATFTVTVSSQPPEATGVPTDITVVEDTASNVDLSAVTFSDGDDTDLIVTLSVDAGTLAATTGGGVTVTGSGTASLELSGNIDDINTYLDTTNAVQYTGAADANGDNAATLTITANDDNGSGDVNVGSANIDITNVNDAAVFGGDLTATMGEDDDTVGGTATATDVDNPDTFQATTPGGMYGDLQMQANGDWVYDLDEANSDVQALNAGDTLQDTITVQSADGSNQDIIITIQGCNDAASFGGDLTGTLNEDTDTLGGTATVTDVDNPDTFTAEAVAGTYGTITIAANGDWVYDLDEANGDVQALAAGDTLQDTITVRANDDTNQDIIITIDGVNDAATFGGNLTGAINEDGTTTTGTATVSDVDTGEGSFNADTIDGANGTIVIAANGDWTYTIDNADSAVQALAAGDTLDDTITVESDDGTTQDIVVTITGVNDLPTSAGGSISTAEDTNKTFTSSNFNFADVDTGDTLQSVRIDTLPTTGTLKLSGTAVTAGDVIAVADIGNLTYSPPANASGSTSFTYTVNDGTGFATSTATMNVSVSARNDAPNNISLSNSSVKETVPGAVIGTVSATDVDDTTLTYTVSDNRFIIDANNQLKLKAGQTLDFETESTVTLTLTATDDDGASDSDEFTITVIDVTEFTGGNDPDTIDGGNDDDFVLTLGGNDRVNTGNGRDTIDGGDGNDDINGGGDDDFLKGGTGNDTVDGGAGNDLVYGGRGDLGNDTVRGSGGFDSLGGGAGNDSISGGDNDDLLWGRVGNDTVDGGTGDDMLYNGEGNDTVIGGTGDDTIWAGADDDLLSGGDGDDVFIFGALSGNDTITDFELANDELNLAYSGAGFAALADVQAAASDTTKDGQDGLLIDLGNGQSVFLIGLDTGDLASMTITL